MTDPLVNPCPRVLPAWPISHSRILLAPTNRVILVVDFADALTGYGLYVAAPGLVEGDMEGRWVGCWCADAHDQGSTPVGSMYIDSRFFLPPFNPKVSSSSVH